jgi:2-keto-4-pentenoate hydratase/2-oxohepta-3-ene-1,7-dioic acid hydratase in catechol pathway
VEPIVRLISFVSGASNVVRLGALTADGCAIDLAATHEARSGNPNLVLSSMIDLIEAGAEGLELAAATIEAADERHILAPANFDYRAPLQRPIQLRDFANYEGHVLRSMETSMRTRAKREPDPEEALKRFQESGQYTIAPVWYQQPIYFKGNRMSVIGHRQDVIWPSYARQMDYELELACVIGARGKDISRSEADNHIFGYTIYNDFSARDALAYEMGFRMGPCKGKDFDTGNIFGPCIVTRDEIPDPYSLCFSIRINGAEVMSGTTAGSQHDFARCIEHVSQSETIYPGEIFGLGTVDYGCGFESDAYLSEGDLVELEVERIGTLANRLVRQ